MDVTSTFRGGIMGVETFCGAIAISSSGAVFFLPLLPRFIGISTAITAFLGLPSTTTISSLTSVTSHTSRFPIFAFDTRGDCAPIDVELGSSRSSVSEPAARALDLRFLVTRGDSSSAIVVERRVLRVTDPDSTRDIEFRLLTRVLDGHSLTTLLARLDFRVVGGDSTGSSHTSLLSTAPEVVRRRFDAGSRIGGDLVFAVGFWVARVDDERGIETVEGRSKDMGVWFGGREGVGGKMSVSSWRESSCSTESRIEIIVVMAVVLVVVNCLQVRGGDRRFTSEWKKYERTKGQQR